MPFDTVGGGDGTFYCSPMRCCFATLALIVIGGIACIGTSIKYLSNGITDTRGKAIATWNDAIVNWDNGGLADFGALGLNLGSNGTKMDYVTGIITPKDFGESSWDSAKGNLDYTFAYYSTQLCPNAGVNQVCNLKISDQAGKQLVQRTLVPNSQSMQRPQSSFCRCFIRSTSNLKCGVVVLWFAKRCRPLRDHSLINLKRASSASVGMTATTIIPWLQSEWANATR